MPAFSRPIVVDGKLVGIACGRRDHRQCSTPGCRNDAGLLCDYPVTRQGKPGTCDRKVCVGCAKHIGKNVDYCAAHGRLKGAAK